AISAFDTPNFTGEDGGRRGMITPEYVEEYALDYGEDHPLYAASVLAEFPDSLEDSLIGREAVESAMARWEAEVAGTGSVVPAEAGTSQPSPVMRSAAEASLGGRSLVQSILAPAFFPVSRRQCPAWWGRGRRYNRRRQVFGGRFFPVARR
ncbi:MAG: hypothetical protein OXE50_12705, partial [Chloroflexi bacterium]|nr:hypothetical protein [Chloroflexota bacterium]